MNGHSAHGPVGAKDLMTEGKVPPSQQNGKHDAVRFDAVIMPDNISVSNYMPHVVMCQSGRVCSVHCSQDPSHVPEYRLYAMHGARRAVSCDRVLTTRRLTSRGTDRQVPSGRSL